MSAHTPGPWRITDRYGVLTYQVGIDGRTVCTVWPRQQGNRPSVVDTEPWPEGEANARLIAAAPDLLAACIAYRDARETDDFDTTADRREALLAAIAKATGSPP